MYKRLVFFGCVCLTLHSPKFPQLLYSEEHKIIIDDRAKIEHLRDFGCVHKLDVSAVNQLDCSCVYMYFFVKYK